ncbi:hypothetical protein EVAR_45302_1 [Eumeta japonica]|uniref:Activity-regulated cytoskeleton associated protein 2 n=1 Tax=Eumeta variegata TaxID=151549 RepID=A0A4C1YBV9_EUMVA|nr:hypothetical protein EVAR_45302_1 [Eumeta japonica]
MQSLLAAAPNGDETTSPNLSSASLGSPFSSAAPACSGSFAKCTARFDGTTSDPEVSEIFLDAIEVYKECLNTNDEHALWITDFLTGDPAGSVRADIFITRVRALFAKLPYKISAITKIDIVYGLLDRRIWKRVPCELIHSLDVLVNKSRLVEESPAETVISMAGTADGVSAFGRLPGSGRVEWPAHAAAVTLPSASGCAATRCALSMSHGASLPRFRHESRCSARCHQGQSVR